MKKTFKLENLDCPNCAAKLERAIKNTDGVIFASVNFMFLKLTVEAADESFDEVMQNVIKAAKKSNPGCKIVL